jgi:hypothetical protein
MHSEEKPWYKNPLSWARRNCRQDILFSGLLVSGVAALIIFVIVMEFNVAVHLEKKIFPNITYPTHAPLSR